MDARISDMLQELFHELEDRHRSFEVAYRDYTNTTNVEDKTDCVEEMMDIYDGMEPRFNMITTYVDRIKSDMIHPSATLLEKEKYQRYLESYQNLKITMEQLNGTIRELLH
jgi:NADPH-dependent 7-cyano-7-deazaguanine reductase QueF